jgi:large subunit ribosomal protein L21
MFAVIRTGGKQYRVSPNDVIVVERLAGEAGSTVELGEVLMLGDGTAEAQIGTPLVDKAAVYAEVLDQARSSKINVFKKKRRKKYRRTHGHRQNVTVLRITEISAAGKRAAARKAEAAPKTAAKTKAAPKEKAAPKRKAAPKTEAAPGADKAAASKAPPAKRGSRAKPPAAKGKTKE